MFSYCINLTEVPNLPEWNIVDANVRGMFYGCESFMDYKSDFWKSDISRWKVTKDKVLYIFYYCNVNFGISGREVINQICDAFKIGEKCIVVWSKDGFFNC